ncbi:F-box/LRR-repeat protein 6 [Centropristis striata]|uniref:F-box/LRR-repeat protein 6 n=1 Tax=Centropristis striata TaxID=184440 RepID=UPI0027DF07C3|nr:F-box/LRR-repeat protein 6 [Centropristis striata]XP_059206746.1 F-box/LRR-repeat protein 6 [Centropristis striata]XP_059206747.1 F-box/LRR-repeat protein 6 [Centropristis striata]
MDSPEAEASTHSEGREDTIPSTSNTSGPGSTEDGPNANKAPLKRTAGKPRNAKAKKRRKASASRPAPLGYTVHQGEDMLLVISSLTSQTEGSAWIPTKKGSKKKKKKLTKGKGKVKQVKKRKTVRAKPKLVIDPVAKGKEDTDLFVAEKATDHRWGQSLPEEVLISIFQMVVVQDGAVPFLCRVGSVCRLWNAAASSPALWRKVAVGHCWIPPGNTHTPKTEKKVKDTFDWLAQNRFSQLRDFSLCHWKKNVTHAVEVVSQFSPHLSSLKLSYCTGLTARAFHSLGRHSQSLQSINLQYSEFQLEGLLEYLEHRGRQLKQILFTHGLKTDRLLTAISRGSCPDLELLEINTKLDTKDCELPVFIPALQMACPKLKTFRMLNVRPRYKMMRCGPETTLGFPLLEELCIATTSFSYMTDKELWDILFGSTKLRVLDLRGCSRITPSGLATLPCPELECLFWGQHFKGTVTNLESSLPKKGLHMVTQKWSQTLQQLDVANQLFTEKDLDRAMSYLAQATEADTLRSLNLTGTRITPPALRPVICRMTALSYLNLSSCRYLPRGMKRLYRGQEDIRQLLDILE